MNRSQHNVFNDRFIIEEIEVLEHHAHAAAVDINVHAHVGNIYTVKYDTSAGRVFHTVQASQKGTFTGAGRTDDNNNVPFVDLHVDALQNIHIPEFLP